MTQGSRLGQRVGRLLERAVASTHATAGGYSGATRERVQLADGTTVFAKAGATPWTAAALRREAAVYRELRQPFVPRMLAADLDPPDGSAPLIVLEDLGDAHWPPPWTSERVQRVRDLLQDITRTPPPTTAGPLSSLREILMRGWSEVAADPTPFLGLGLCSPDWLDSALPVLLAAQDDADFDGDALTHFDVRSDNLCFAAARTVIVDWSSACTAHPLTDLILWLPSLHAEGGPPPEAILPDAPAAAVAVMAGFWAANAGREPIPDAPLVRTIQRRQLATALPWAARALRLPDPHATTATASGKTA